MFVPATPGGLLRKMLIQMEENLEYPGRVKYVEQLGSTIEDILATKDPWGGPCGIERCLLCQNKPGKCNRQGVVYRIDCPECKAQEKEVVYFGESARCGMDRAIEHGYAISKRMEKHPVVAHYSETHPEKTPVGVMSLVRVLTRPLERQAMEGLLISNFKGTAIMNSRGDWGQNLPPEIIVEQNGKRSREKARMAIDRNSGGGAPNPNGERDQERIGEGEVSKDTAEDPPPKKRRKRCDEVGYTPAPPIRSKSLTVKELLTAMRERALHQASGEKIQTCESRGDERGDGVHDPGQELDEAHDDGGGTDRLGLETGGAQGFERMICEKLRDLSCGGEAGGSGEALTTDGIDGHIVGTGDIRSMKIKSDYTDVKCGVKWDEGITCDVLKGETDNKASSTVQHTSKATENDKNNSTEEGDLDKDEDFKDSEVPGPESLDTERSLDSGERNRNLNL